MSSRIRSLLILGLALSVMAMFFSVSVPMKSVMRGKALTGAQLPPAAAFAQPLAAPIATHLVAVATPPSVHFDLIDMTCARIC